MDAERLRSVPLFSELSKHERERVARWADEVDVQAGEHLVRQGDFAHEFFVIEEGTASVTAGDKQLGDLGPGDYFGEIALLETDRRTASVTATSPMRLIVMHSRDFSELASEFPDIADRLRSKIAERLKR